MNLWIGSIAAYKWVTDGLVIEHAALSHLGETKEEAAGHIVLKAQDHWPGQDGWRLCPVAVTSLNLPPDIVTAIQALEEKKDG